MNFIAHLLLSGKDEDLLLGNFLGDFLKNKEVVKLPVKMQKGVELHRFIDSFTDAHDAVKNSTSRLHHLQGKYAPVVVDIFYDYILYNNWNTYSVNDFIYFKNSAYSIIRRNNVIPDRIAGKVNAMVDGDFLMNYTHRKGLEWVFHQVAKRSRFENNIHNAFHDANSYYSDLESDFHQMFQDLIKEVREVYQIS